MKSLHWHPLRRCGARLMRGLTLPAVVLALSPVAHAQMTIPAQAPLPGSALQPAMRNLQYANGPRGGVAYLANANGAMVTMPATAKGPDYSLESGLQLSFNADPVGQYGYRPVEFTFSARTPAVQDLSITVQFNAGDYVSGGESITAEDTLVFPKGATTATLRMLVPQYQDWYLFGWRVLIDGRSDIYLAIDDVTGPQFGPSVSNMAVLLAGATTEQSTAYHIALDGAYSGSALGVKSLQLAELPTNWVEYSTLDVVVLPANQVGPLLQSHPKQAAGLFRWVRAGGNLWITEAGANWGGLQAVTEALYGAAAEAVSASSPARDEASPANNSAPELTPERQLLAHGWRRPPTNERASEPVEAALLLSGFETEQSGTELLQSFVSSSWAGTVAPYIPAWADAVRGYLRRAPGRQVLVRGYGLGAIAAFPLGLGGQYNPAGNPLFVTLNQTFMQPRVSWATRHGNQPNSFNKDFNKLLIPDVGVAPVGMFQVLITLFVLGIGPVNYWFLRRQNKLPLLLFTVPAAAIVTTGLLFAYGMFADGFGVQTRSRTLTLIDQRTGEAASWGRLSYYAGIAPRGGLTVPRDQAMYPMNPEWAMGYRTWTHGAMQPQREIVWADSQRLTAGWLPSRTPTQYQAVAARKSSRKLDVRPTADGIRVANRLGTDVSHLAIEDHQGRMFWCEALAADEVQSLRPAERDAVTSEVLRLFRENLPEAPVGADAGYTGAGYDFIASQSVMEGRLGAISWATIKSWGRGKYIAFTKEAIELDLGVDDSDDQASFHVVEGTW